MSGPFTTITVEHYYELQDVLRLSNSLLQCIAEFPDDPKCWAEWIEALENAVQKAKR